MDIAYMKYGRGEASLVTAVEVEKRFGGSPPYGARFLCPACNQRLIPCAMGRYYTRRPYFSHEANNQNAQDCEYFVANMGMGGSTYQRAPLPMFIRRALGRHDQYVVEGGFTALSPSILPILERSDAELRVGSSRYRITRARFGDGITRLPFEEISLTPRDYVTLENTTLALEDVWGSPETAKRAMVFTRDPDSNRGKRLRSGDTVPLGSYLYLLTPMQGIQAITDSFPSSTRLGMAGSLYGGSRLQVIAAALPNSGGYRSRAAQYLETCGFRIGTQRDAFRLIWPPSLTSGGEVEPVFQGRDPIFTVSNSSTDGSSVYLHRSISDQDAPESLGLHSTVSGSFAVVMTGKSNSTGILAMRRDSLADSVFITPYDDDVPSTLSDEMPRADIVEEDGEIHVRLGTPGSIVRMSRKLGRAENKIDWDTPVVLHQNDDEAVSVRRYLHIPRGGYVSLFTHFGETKDQRLSDSPGAAIKPREQLMARHRADGVNLSLRRIAGSETPLVAHAGKSLAQIRRS